MVTFTPAGFFPAAITVAAGDRILHLRNGSKVQSPQFELRVIGPVTAKQSLTKPAQRDWAGLVTLSPGNYEIREVNYPNFLCRITVVSK